MFYLWFKGATMYEFQLGNFCFGIIHLRGKAWGWKFWRRFRRLKGC